MASLPFISSFSFLIVFTALASAAATTIKVSLSPLPHHSSSNVYQILNNLATSSVARAHHLKHHNPKAEAKTNTSSSLLKAPISPHSYGGYTMSLKFGTPPQDLTFIMDTGSSLSWFPCTSRYLCSRNPKCSWLFGSNVESRCRECEPTSKNCTQTCPPYLIQYGLGSTGGLLLVENLVFPHKIFTDFLVGCSVISNRQPAGIAGFGRSAVSLPSQLGLKKFSYCLVSRRFDDTGISSDMLLETGSGSRVAKTPGLSYTPFYKNQAASNPALKEFYYVTLRKILVGDKTVKVPYSFLVAGSDGNGGTIIDSGSTLTFMERPVFELVSKELEKQMGNYSRALQVEKMSGLAHVSIFQATTQGLHGGPAIILGNFQQQNYHIEFDLENDRWLPAEFSS
ncbi:hypothetical protein F3Y22_tig00112507pilonHSYRG00227 [Hibiscus syriacus]|uniref:Peptidase A1 domain-containing protein n=1 Tax=Hibiscus syriacus TaxID=106335 RepID=A0A6A2XGA9_HIBSY|nr:hypothetical protein F3Y22_tig00112507pilonHSYRG00227 [Hibiscus syriacus]